jgi:hypothetical protein
MSSVAEAVAREFGDTCQVIGIVSSDLSANRVEILVRLAPSPRHDGRVMIGVARSPEAEFPGRFRAALERARAAYHDLRS